MGGWVCHSLRRDPACQFCEFVTASPAYNPNWGMVQLQTNCAYCTLGRPSTSLAGHGLRSSMFCVQHARANAPFLQPAGICRRCDRAHERLRPQDCTATLVMHVLAGQEGSTGGGCSHWGCAGGGRHAGGVAAAAVARTPAGLMMPSRQYHPARHHQARHVSRSASCNAGRWNAASCERMQGSFGSECWEAECNVCRVDRRLLPAFPADGVGLSVHVMQSPRLQRPASEASRSDWLTRRNRACLECSWMRCRRLSSSAT